MDVTQRQQEQRIERYILKKMCDEEATEFEIEYLGDQACIEQLEIAKKLHQGLNAVSSADIVTNQTFTKTPAWWQKNVPVWSIAATVLVMLMPFSLMMQPKVTSSLPNLPISVINIDMAGSRGLQDDVLIITRTNQQLIISAYIDTDLEYLNYDLYAFRLLNQKDNTPIVTLTDITLQDSMLYFNLGKNVVTSGLYRYSITGQTNRGENIKLKEGKLSINNQP